MMENFKIEPTESGKEIQTIEAKEGGLLRKLHEFKKTAIFAMALGAFSVGLEAVSPSEAYAEFQGENTNIEVVQKKTTLEESKHFTNKNGYQVKYIAGKQLIVIDGKDMNLNLSQIQVKDGGSLQVKGDESTYEATFARYAVDGEENLDVQTRVVEKHHKANPYIGVPGFTKEMQKSSNPELAREKAAAQIANIFHKTIILASLKEAGKEGTPEFKKYASDIKMSIEQVRAVYGGQAIHAEAFDAMMK